MQLVVGQLKTEKEYGNSELHFIIHFNVQHSVHVWYDWGPRL